MDEGDPAVTFIPAFVGDSMVKYVASADVSAAAYLRSSDYPGRHVKLNAAGEAWARDCIAGGSPFVKSWTIEKARK
jgi:hypothetical protein